MKSRYKRNSQSYIRMQSYEMYKNGFNFYDIAAKFHISHQRAENEVIAYIKTHNIDPQKLESDRDVIAKLNNALNKANHAHIQPGYGIKQSENHILKTYSKDDLESRFPEPHLSLFNKIKLAIYHFIFFWK